MKERRKKPRRDWVVGDDGAGKSVLEWKIDYRDLRRQESDPCARTYDLLKRLDAPNLQLEDDSEQPRKQLDPYGKAGRKKRTSAW
jgi:hypothetical protein